MLIFINQAAGSASIMKLKKSLLERHQQLTTSADAAATAARIQEAAVSQASAAAERVRKQVGFMPANYMERYFF